MRWPFRSMKNRLPDPDTPNWERALINEMVVEYLKKERRSRRWALVFKLGIVAYFALGIVVLYEQKIIEAFTPKEPHVALVKVEGVIAPEAEASADRIITALRKAFEAEESKAVILRINSPGGSPVQAGYVNDEITRLKAKYPDKPVYAVAVDACASGAYYIAVAADQIYVDPASIVGSIGVRMDSFDFSKAIDELGIQRRLLTAGQHKGILDPFEPMTEFDATFLNGLLDGLHQQFIAAVKAGRGDRLSDNDELFTGLFWTGEQSIALGLADGIGSSSSVAREIVGEEKLVSYTVKRNVLDRLAQQVGTSLASSLAQAIGVKTTTGISY